MAYDAMPFNEFIEYLEKKALDEGKNEILVEINFFFYYYIAGVSRVSYEGWEYVCFSAGTPMYYYDLTEDEKKLCEQKYHIYIVGYKPFAVFDPSLQKAIIDIYEKQLADYYAKLCSK